MAIFKKKQVETVEVVSFDQFVEYGKQNGGNIVNGMPWSFEYRGMPVTHENDNCYLVANQHFTKDDVLIIDNIGNVYPCNIGTFNLYYEPAE